MAYFTKDHLAALTVTPEELRALPVDTRVDFALRQFETDARKKEVFWNAVEGIATGVIPILVVFGVLRRG